MIPDFNDDGYLPPGIHVASLKEVGARFGEESELRRVQFQSLTWLMDLARRARALKLIINGSFVTDALEPNDVDCALLLDCEAPLDPTIEVELEEGLPFIDLHVVGEEDFSLFVHTIYGTDRHAVRKGVIEDSL